eukprot:829695-Pyramimonas_sp.AAC.1
MFSSHLLPAEADLLEHLLHEVVVDLIQVQLEQRVHHLWRSMVGCKIEYSDKRDPVRQHPGRPESKGERPARHAPGDAVSRNTHLLAVAARPAQVFVVLPLLLHASTRGNVLSLPSHLAGNDTISLISGRRNATRVLASASDGPVRRRPARTNERRNRLRNTRAFHALR